MILRVRLTAPSGEVVREFAVSAFPARIGRDSAVEIPVDDHQFPVVSGLHAEIDRIPAGFVLIAKSVKNLTLHNDRPVEGPVPLRVGDRIRLGATGPTVLIVDVELPQIEPLEADRTASQGLGSEPAKTRAPHHGRRVSARAAILLAAGLILHLAGILLCLVLMGVIANPLASGPSPRVEEPKGATPKVWITGKGTVGPPSRD